MCAFSVYIYISKPCVYTFLYIYISIAHTMVGLRAVLVLLTPLKMDSNKRPCRLKQMIQEASLSRSRLCSRFVGLGRKGWGLASSHTEIP